MTHFKRGLIAAALIAPWGAEALSQERLDTIIVTTIGPDRAATELIGNATALDRDEILDTLSASLGDTLDRQPGVASTAFGQGASRPVLRGLGSERVQVLTNGIGVIDVSAASPDHQVATDGIDAQRIEILRGPAALAYGGQAIGGVVNVIDGLIVEDLPERNFSVDAFGAFNTVNNGEEFAARLQLADGPIAFTLTASTRDFDNFDIPDFAESELFRELEESEEDGEEGEEEEVRGTLENSFVRTDSLAGGLSWVGENAFAGIAVRHQASVYGLPGHVEEEGEEEGGEEEGEEEEENPFIDLEQTRVDLRAGIDFDRQFLTNIVGSLSIADYEHIEFEAPGEAGTVFNSDGFEGRVEVGHKVGLFEGSVGIQLSERDLSALGEEAFISPTTTENFSIFLYETTETDAGFGLEAGARFESVDLENDIFGSEDFDLFSGSIGVHHHLNDIFLGGQVSFTERAPNESELFAFGPHLATSQFEVGDTSLSKESGLNIEGTARWTIGSFNVGVNAFFTNFSDFIFLTPGAFDEDGVAVTVEDGLPVFLFTQQDADFFGGEIYADYTLDNFLGAEWRIDASVDLVEAELDDGGNVPFIPPVTFNSDLTAEWAGWSIGAALTIAGDQNDAGLGQLPTDGYTQLDLRAALHLSQFGFVGKGSEIFIDARNITDDEIRFATSVLKDVAPAPGQNFRVGLRATF